MRYRRTRLCNEFRYDTEMDEQVAPQAPAGQAEVFLQSPTPDEVRTISEALDRGLKPAGFSVGGTAVILRFALNESRTPLQEE
ncbi:MAG: hypothetical protein WCE53_13670 [Candidatus Acidiferrum sp.]